MMIYLASPYSHNDSNIRHQRFRRVCAKAGELMAAGEMVFCPVAHSHPIAVIAELPCGWEYWEAFDRQMLSVCTKLVVYMLPGWDISTGIRNEIEIADELGLPIEYLPWTE